MSDKEELKQDIVSEIAFLKGRGSTGDESISVCYFLRACLSTIEELERENDELEREFNAEIDAALAEKEAEIEKLRTEIKGLRKENKSNE